MTTDPTCCGQGGAWAAAGEPLRPGCALCPNSPTYWRQPENRADGRPYEPSSLRESYRSLNTDR